MTGQRRALVLGGGGLVGIAWELGIIAGLAERGVDLSTADVVIGTSAGSAVGAQLGSGLPPSELHRRQLETRSGERAASIGTGVLARYALTLGLWPDRTAGRARLGRMALRTDPGVTTAERRAVIAARLPTTDWPAGFDLRITAIDTATGELRIFDASSGVDLVDAVAASCAVPLVWPPVDIGGRRYMDGGMRNAVNADLAAGADRVVVLAPVPRGFRRTDRPDRQVAALGPAVAAIVVTPSATARTAFGRNALDPARRAPSARAGLAQSAEVADTVAAVWS